MGFKLNGMNFGKGTGSAKGFSQVTLNPNTRDDPNAQEYIDWHTKKYGYPPPGDGTGQAGATVEGETYEDLKNKEKASEANEMMFEDLTNRLEEYKNDPYKVQILPQGAKLKNSDYKDWLKKNAPQLKKDGLLDINWKPGQKPKKFDARRLFNQKIDESRNIDNDLRLSAEQGYGFNEDQLFDYGIRGGEFNVADVDADGNPIPAEGREVVNLDVSEYAPNPTFQANVEINKENLQLENVKKIGNKRMNKIKKAIKEGKDIPTSDLSWLASRGPQYDISEFNQFIHDYVMPYQQHTAGGTRKSNKQADKLQDLLDSGMSIDQAYAELNITAPSTEGKTISFSNDTRQSKMGGQLLDKFENNNEVGSDRFLWDDSPGLDLSADEDDTEHTDDFTAMMDKDIASMNQNEGEEEGEEEGNEEVVTNKGNSVAIGSGGDENELEETETKEEEFDPRDTNKDGTVDKWEEKAAKRAAMFAKKEEYDSAYPKWNNKKMENMANETLMNADRNPFKFGSKNHEEWNNNKSRAKGLAIKQQYKKFL
tara:strand:- start:1192 stop:2805 length:1614 start_codon:yes stop_codon:yes gene_type:complete